ncbi:hypothetical protein [Paenibacillus sp. NPDC057934]|uniref:hypothetical protein n=1 Tax=Paenibacillus sp. NPDC057934 TaxID=3346282 RepID=UPI0036D7C622
MLGDDMVDIGFLTRWEQEHNAIQRTIEGFWNAFCIWENQDKDGYHGLFLGKLDEDFIMIVKVPPSFVPFVYIICIQ